MQIRETVTLETIVKEQALDDSFAIPSFPSVCERKRTAKIVLNELVKENKDLYYTAVALASYPIHKWVMETREDIGLTEDVSGISSKALVEIVQKQKVLVENCGVEPVLRQTKNQNRMERTAEIVYLIDNALDWLEGLQSDNRKAAAVLKAVHCIDRREVDEKGNRISAVSAFLIDQYYRRGVLLIHDMCGERLKELILSEVEEFEDLDEESAYAFHNTNLLLHVAPMIYRKYMDYEVGDASSEHKAQTATNSLGYLSIVYECAEEIYEFPVHNKEMGKIIELLLSGKDQGDVRKKMGLAHYRFNRLYKEAVTLMSYVLWGYSTQQIIRDLISFEQIRKY